MYSQQFIKDMFSRRAYRLKIAWIILSISIPVLVHVSSHLVWKNKNKSLLESSPSSRDSPLPPCLYILLLLLILVLFSCLLQLYLQYKVRPISKGRINYAMFWNSQISYPSSIWIFLIEEIDFPTFLLIFFSLPLYYLSLFPIDCKLHKKRIHGPNIIVKG